MIKNKYIVKNKAIQNGTPVIAGTRIPVIDIVSLVDEQKISPKEIVTKYFTHISLDQVNGALKWHNSQKNRYA